MILGYEIEDILRVVIGVTLGLLTIFRREMSCNRVFHEEDETLLDINPANEDEDSSRPSLEGSSSKFETIRDEQNKRKSIRRRKSSSSLPSLTSPRNTPELEGVGKDQYDDPTEELLEAAGLFLSGGPFLAVFIAVFDHLVACTYVYALLTFESMRSIIASFRTDACYEDLHVERHVHDDVNPSKVQPNKEEVERENQHIYNVAWNAATEYFSSISAKLDETTTDLNINNPSPTRSKSTGNLLQHLSDENSRTLLLEMIAMANRGSMDVTLLPHDAQILICSYLPPNDLLSFACTNKSGRKMLDDGYHSSTQENVDGPSICRDSALLIWKALFRRDFAWILSDWNIGREAFLRSMACYNNIETLQGHQSSHHKKVLDHVLSVVMHSNEMWNEIEPFNTPFTGIISTPSSMKQFYFLFSEVWLNYTIAGCSTTENCLIGLHGHVFDISNFVEDHPGSTETLLLQAGRDATVFFESMGHSRSARKLALGMTVVVNSQCVHWHYPEGLCGSSNEPSTPCGLLRPSSKLLGANKNIPGFLIPTKRSKPRFQGGLHVIRNRLKEEQEVELQKAQRWVNVHLGSGALYGGVQVYYDPFCSCWRWWYLNLDFDPVFSESMD